MTACDCRTFGKHSPLRTSGVVAGSGKGAVPCSVWLTPLIGLNGFDFGGSLFVCVFPVSLCLCVSFNLCFHRFLALGTSIWCTYWLPYCSAAGRFVGLGMPCALGAILFVLPCLWCSGPFSFLTFLIHDIRAILVYFLLWGICCQIKNVGLKSWQEQRLQLIAPLQ